MSELNSIAPLLLSAAEALANHSSQIAIDARQALKAASRKPLEKKRPNSQSM